MVRDCDLMDLKTCIWRSVVRLEWYRLRLREQVWTREGMYSRLFEIDKRRFTVCIGKALTVNRCECDKWAKRKSQQYNGGQIT